MNERISKHELRQLMKKVRKKALVENIKASLTAQNFILNSTIWHNCQKPALYSALPGEVNVEHLFQSALTQGKTPLLPAIINQRSREMKFFHTTNLSNLEKGPLRIMQPIPSCPSFTPDLIIAPGLAFDFKGNRLGYGGGYYDYFLHGHPECTCIGICFSSQLVDYIPAECWDMPMHAICSEAGLTFIREV